MENLDLHYFLHGLIILMVGLVGGLPFASAIKKQNGTEVAWRVVHAGASMGGTMLIAIGAIINRLNLSPLLNSIIFWGIIISTYALIVGMVIAAITGKRGIGNKVGQGIRWKLVYVLYFIGAVFSILSIGLLIIVCFCKLI